MRSAIQARGAVGRLRGAACRLIAALVPPRKPNAYEAIHAILTISRWNTLCNIDVDMPMESFDVANVYNK